MRIVILSTVFLKFFNFFELLHKLLIFLLFQQYMLNV